MKKKIRTVSFHELRVETIATGDCEIEPTQSNFIDVLTPIAGLLKKRVTYGKGASAVELVDFKLINNSLYLLINKVNPELPDIGYYKLSSKTRRRPEKDTDEHREQSAHVLIEARSNTNLARLKITSGAGISAGKIKKIISDVYKFNKGNKKIQAIQKRNWPTGVEENGKKKEYEVIHSFSVATEPSELLCDILDKNSILELDLIDNSQMAFDESGVSIKKRTFTLEGKMPSTIEGLKKIMGIGKLSGFDIDTNQLRIIYAEEESEKAFEARKRQFKNTDDHRKFEKKIKTINAKDLEKAFTRSDKIYLDSEHPEIQMELSEEIMKGLDSL